MVKQTPPCNVCQKPANTECSHVECPNRKRMTAALPHDASVQQLRGGGYIRVPIRYD